MSRGPQRIVCLTEESVEWLYLLGEQRRIVGISAWTVRPPEARRAHPVVSDFLNARTEKICALRPDLVLGFSDLQANIAQELIKAGLNVWISNQRSVEEIFAWMAQIGDLVDQRERADAWIGACRARHRHMAETAARWRRRPRIWFEEWDDPPISAIRWVAELVRIAGGEDIFPELAEQSLGKDRILADRELILQRNPDLMLASWCGKPFSAKAVVERPGWGALPWVQAGHLHELPSAEILQPGPGALGDGVERIHRILCDYQRSVEDHHG